MTNFGSKILNNAIGSLNAQQAVIAVIGNNIANVNTEGYARRTVDLRDKSTSNLGGGLSVGNGVEVNRVVQQVDLYREKVLRTTAADKFKADVKNSYLERAQSLFPLDAEAVTIGSSLNSFFQSLNTLSQNPASIELRMNVIQKGENLVTSITDTYQTVADLQDEADSRLVTEIDTVNNITEQIADLNQKVKQIEGSGGQALDERDLRTNLLDALSQKINYSVTEVSDGTIDITLSTGLALVSGTASRSLEVTKSPSFASGSLPPSLNGGVLNFIVFDFDSSSSTSHIDLTGILGNQSGTVGGLLQMRGIQSTSDTSAFDASGLLTNIASRVEALTRQLLTQVNQTYLGADEDSGTVGLQPSSGDLNGNTPANVYNLFNFAFSGLESAKDDDGDGNPDDLLSAGLGIDNYSSILQFGLSDPTEFAAALDLDATAASTSFTQGDSRNAQAILALQETALLFSAGSFSQTGTFSEVYNQMVSFVGNEKSKAEINARVATGKYDTALNQRDEVSKVNLDEEFANLIRFQKAYEASARMVSIGSKLLDELLNIIN